MSVLVPNVSALPGLAVMSDLNAYVLGYGIHQGTGGIFYAVSTGSPDPFDTSHQWIDTGHFSDSIGLTSDQVNLAYMPGSGGNVGRLFSTWTQAGTVFICELGVVKDAATGIVSITGLAGPGPTSLYNIPPQHAPSIAVVGNYVVVAFNGPGSNIYVAISNDVVTSPGQFVFQPLPAIIDPNGVNEQVEGGVAITAVPGNSSRYFLAWKGLGNADVSVASYALATNAPEAGSKVAITNITYNTPALTFTSGQLYLVYSAEVNNHLCTWAQAKWNINNATPLPDTTTSRPAACATVNAVDLVIGYSGTDQQHLLNISGEPH